MGPRDRDRPNPSGISLGEPARLLKGPARVRRPSRPPADPGVALGSGPRSLLRVLVGLMVLLVVALVLTLAVAIWREPRGALGLGLVLVFGALAYGVGGLALAWLERRGLA